MKKYKTGYKTTKNLVGQYNGFFIYRIVTEVREWDRFYRCYTDRIVQERIGYQFSKKENGPLFECYRYSLEDITNCIDEFISGNIYYMTKADRRKYITKPNEECGWGFNKEDCQKFLEEHKKGNMRTKYIIEERLEDANFHTFCGLLSNMEYDKAMKYIEEDYA